MPRSGAGPSSSRPMSPASDNVAARSGYRRGDIDAALAGSDVVGEGRFTTSWVHQGYLEPQVATAALDEHGVLHLTSATQGTFQTRWELARLFGRPMAAVRVTGATLGGAFGGKYLIVDPLAAAATLVLGRPVRVELTRNEDFRMTNPAPATILEVRAGATRDGRLRGLQARLAVRRRRLRRREHRRHRCGADHRALPLGRPRGRRLRGRDQSIRDRRLPCARCDPGGLCARAADRRARATPGDGPRRAPAAQPRHGGRRDGRRDGVGRDRPVRLPGPGRTSTRSTVIGRRCQMAKASGSPRAPGQVARGAASAICRLEADGRVTVVTGVVDMSGTMTGFAAIAAEGLGLAAEDVSVVAADTASAPRSPFSGGSVVTYSLGGAVMRATAVLREKILGYAALALEIDVRDLELVDGIVRPKGTPERGSRWPTSGSGWRAGPRATSRWRAMPADPARARAVDRRPPGPPPRRPRQRRGPRPRPRRRPGRRPALNPAISRASSTVARPRVSAGRCRRRCSSTTPASC